VFQVKTPKAKGVFIPPKVKVKAAGGRATELPATLAEEDSAGPAPAATTGLVAGGDCGPCCVYRWCHRV